MNYDDWAPTMPSSISVCGEHLSQHGCLLLCIRTWFVIFFMRRKYKCTSVSFRKEIILVPGREGRQNELHNSNQNKFNNKEIHKSSVIFIFMHVLNTHTDVVVREKKNLPKLNGSFVLSYGFLCRKHFRHITIWRTWTSVTNSIRILCGRLLCVEGKYANRLNNVYFTDCFVLFFFLLPST